MKKFIISLIICSAIYSQLSARAGLILPSEEHSPNLISIGAGYSLLHQENLSVGLIGEYAFPTESGTELNVFEIGGGLLYHMADHISAIASVMYSAESAHGESHSDVIFLAGLGYELIDHLELEAVYGVNGNIKGPRFAVAFHF
ncbi:MAG: hypothetical protein KDD94_01410 [Calditrichaeota bacterium]|nr:hypothetical protein [Calditrichota bacterium]